MLCYYTPPTLYPRLEIALYEAKVKWFKHGICLSSGGRSGTNPGLPFHPDSAANRGHQWWLCSCHSLQGKAGATFFCCVMMMMYTDVSAVIYIDVM